MSPSVENALSKAYVLLRHKTKALCEPLLTEDYVVQSIEDVSPPKWHLAHSSWFFEYFILKPYSANYQLFDPMFTQLFNSYYQSVGNPYPRAKRGLLSRPSVETIYRYRDYVDEQLLELLSQGAFSKNPKLASLLVLGIEHEKQHQELLLMDIKYNFSINPILPNYAANKPAKSNPSSKLEYLHAKAGLVSIGHQGDGFCFDNEKPAHRVFLKPFLIANRLSTNAEYLDFILSGGYQDPQWWLSDGWDFIKANQWQAPLYWQLIDHEWYLFTLHGLQKLNLQEPVSHISYYEADAFARFSNKRLPTEAEWEHFVIANHQHIEGNFLESDNLHPLPAALDKKANQFFGDLWEWTASPYVPYPGFRAAEGRLSEYNGKFMSNQMVLRGGCCVSPKDHIRASYRNFFQPAKRWQFSGVRLASDIEEDLT